MNILDWSKRKLEKKKISMVTCYDYTSAKIVAQTHVDAILVGDSAAMTMHGHSSTLPATVDMMCTHIQSVARGAPNKFIVGDVPFLANRMGLTANVEAVQKIMQAGAHAIKIEGANGNENFIQHIVSSGVPVMGHLGLTPQSVHQLGGYKVQGRHKSDAELLIESAKLLEKWGVFSVVLECVPASLANQISAEIQIPTIGIGAGPGTDGQILVFQDLLGLNLDFQPKFVRQYLNGANLITEALNTFCRDVSGGQFPNEKESFE